MEIFKVIMLQKMMLVYHNYKKSCFSSQILGSDIKKHI